MYFATPLEPTNETPFTLGCVSSVSTVSLPPWTTFTTPAGTPASSSSSTMRTAVRGTFSLGFSTNVLPQAIAMGNIQSGTIAGKLNGVMPAQTPIGTRSVCPSVPVPTRSTVSPIINVGAPQANSTDSNPRINDARDSSSVLP